MHFDVIVIGGGAAGLMCAIEAGRRGRRVLVIERNREVGRKIPISGGGRCNFTNRAAAPENFPRATPTSGVELLAARAPCSSSTGFRTLTRRRRWPAPARADGAWCGCWEERHARRFAQAWAGRYGSAQPLRELSKRELETLAGRLRAWRLVPSGSEGYAKAEVTAGGVDTHELSSRTLECRRVPGLYFIGEAVDVTGWLGGFDFQWAWASGHAAGQAA